MEQIEKENIRPLDIRFNSKEQKILNILSLQDMSIPSLCEKNRKALMLREGLTKEDIVEFLKELNQIVGRY